MIILSERLMTSVD